QPTSGPPQSTAPSLRYRASSRWSPDPDRDVITSRAIARRSVRRLASGHRQSAPEQAMADTAITASPAVEAPALSAVEGTVEAYVATWNETDAARRQAGIARAW